MKLIEITSEVEKGLAEVNPAELTEFKKLTESRIYIWICCIMDIFIRFLKNLSARFNPIVEILLQFRHELEELKRKPEDYNKEEREEETETVHYGGHYTKAHDVIRHCHNHPDKDRQKIEELKEENRVLRIEIDESENTHKQKEEAYQNSLNELEHKNKELEAKIKEMDLQMSSETSHWPSSMNRYPGGTTFKNGCYKDYDQRMEQEENEDHSVSRDKQNSGRGARPGHKGYSGRLLDDIKANEIIELYPERIPEIDRDHYEWEVAGIHWTLGVKFETVITEYRQMETKIKGDRSPAITVKGVFPPQAKSEISYDSGFIWLVEIYYTIGLMGMGRIAQIIRTAFGVTMSKSTVNNILKKAGNCLRKASACIAGAMKEDGKDPECVYTADETKLSIGQSNYYDHVLVGYKYALHTISSTRGLEGLFKSGVLTDYNGWLVTDFFGMYKRREWKSAFDRAHLTRELNAAAQLDPDSEWIKKMQEWFYQSYKAYHNALDKQMPISEQELKELEEEYDKAVQTGKEEIKNQNYNLIKNLLKRFINFKDGIMACLYNVNIFLTSNAAERQCKQIKPRMDVSGHFESFTGAEDFAAALTVIETAKLQNLNTIDALQQILGGNIDYLVTGIRDDSISTLTQPIMTTERSQSKK